MSSGFYLRLASSLFGFYLFAIGCFGLFGYTSISILRSIIGIRRDENIQAKEKLKRFDKIFSDSILSSESPFLDKGRPVLALGSGQQ